VALAFYVPPGEAWLHEEWHRAVLSHCGIASYNDTYKFRLFGGVVNVSHVRDEDLERLKREHPAEFVRLAAAGSSRACALCGDRGEDRGLGRRKRRSRTEPGCASRRRRDAAVTRRVSRAMSRGEPRSLWEHHRAAPDLSRWV
jgi:hypothetical protein